MHLRLGLRRSGPSRCLHRGPSVGGRDAGSSPARNRGDAPVAGPERRLPDCFPACTSRDRAPMQPRDLLRGLRYQRVRPSAATCRGAVDHRGTARGLGQQLRPNQPERGCRDTRINGASAPARCGRSGGMRRDRPRRAVPSEPRICGILRPRPGRSRSAVAAGRGARGVRNSRHDPGRGHGGARGQDTASAAPDRRSRARHATNSGGMVTGDHRGCPRRTGVGSLAASHEARNLRCGRNSGRRNDADPVGQHSHRGARLGRSAVGDQPPGIGRRIRLRHRGDRSTAPLRSDPGLRRRRGQLRRCQTSYTRQRAHPRSPRPAFLRLLRRRPPVPIRRREPPGVVVRPCSTARATRDHKRLQVRSALFLSLLSRQSQPRGGVPDQGIPRPGGVVEPRRSAQGLPPRTDLRLGHPGPDGHSSVPGSRPGDCGTSRGPGSVRRSGVQ